MYLTERLFALIVYVLTLWIVCFLIAKLGRKYIAKILWVYVVILSIMSFNFVPASGADLYRLIPIMHIWANLSYNQLWNEMLHSTNPTYILYMNLIGKFGIDGLLPAITCFLFYSNVFYILKKSVIRYQVKGSDAALVLFFFMSTGVLIEVISGIRTMLGFSIIAVCLFKELIEGKSVFKNIIWYVVASLLHPAVLVLTIVRFIYFAWEKNKNIYIRLSRIIITVIASIVLLFVGKDYFIASYEKGISYLIDSPYSYFWEYLIGGISLLFIIYLEFLTSKLIRLRENTESIKNLLNFCKILTIFLFIFIIEYNTFHRFVIVLSILAIPLLSYILSSPKCKKNTIINFRLVVFAISCFIIFVACARGNLTSLKFFIF